MKKTIVAALFVTALAAPAMAQEAAPFTGPRIEALVGYDRLGGTGSGSQDGIAYGAAAGYDFQLGGLVAGVEAEYVDSDVKGCATGAVVANDRLCANAGRDLYVGGRIGTAVTPNTLVYAKAGYTNARVGASYTDATTPANNFRLSDEADGVRVGAGVEQQFGGGIYAKAEYRYSNYEGGLDRHQALAGLGFRF